MTLRLGFDLATGAPWNGTAGGLLQPLFGIAILALALKIPGLMRRGAAGENFVSTIVGTAAGIGLSRVMTGGRSWAEDVPAVASGPRRPETPQ
jgi:hypothetical protein